MLWEQKNDKRENFVMVCGDREFNAEVEEQWDLRLNPVHVEYVSGWKAACKLLESRAPAVILLEEQTSGSDSGAEKVASERLQALVSLFADHAPTIVVASAEQQADLRALLACGKVDFVARTAGCLTMAMALVERRLRWNGGGR